MTEGMKVTLVLGFFVAAIALVGIVNVYGERSTVEVPFDFHGNSCTFDEQNVIYTCTWEGSSETVTSEGRAEAGVIDEEQLAEERKEAHEIAEALEEKPTKQSENEKLLERIADKIDKGTATPADKELYRLLKVLHDTCFVGVEEGRLIQDYEEYTIPFADPRNDVNANFDYVTNTHLGRIIKTIEACEGWDAYKGKFLGERYLNIEKDDSTSQIFHAKIAENLKKYPQPKLTSESFDVANQKAHDYICNASFYSHEYKKKQGCFPTIDTIPGLGIEPDTPAYRAYLLYMQTGSVDLSSLKKTEEVKALQQTADSFAQEQGIDAADLKNWLAEQRDQNGGQK